MKPALMSCAVDEDLDPKRQRLPGVEDLVWWRDEGMEGYVA